MMRSPQDVICVIDKIVSFCMVKGVQPDELVTAVFEDEYQSVDTCKKNGYVYLTITYKDEGNLIKNRYIYNLERRLEKIEQKIHGSKFKVQWDRSDALNQLVIELTNSAINNNLVYEDIMRLIPESLKGIVSPRLHLIAA